MSATKIEWCDETINPVVGCTKCSPGCDSCYAERFAVRLAKHPNPRTRARYAGIVDAAGKWTGQVSEPDYSVFDRLPKIPKRVFVGSMTDLFFRGTNDYGRKALTTVDGTELEFAPDTMHVRMAQILLRVGNHPQHTFMILTKRPKEMGEAMELLLKKPLPNLWLGVTVCNQKEADEKIPELLDVDAALRFISLEPLLGPVSFWKWFPYGSCRKPSCYYGKRHILNTEYQNGIGWIICGGETGPGARPVHPDWIRSLRDQCQKAKVPFFLKSLGEWQIAESKDFNKFPLVTCDKQAMHRVGKERAGSLLDGRKWNEVPT